MKGPDTIVDKILLAVGFMLLLIFAWTVPLAPDQEDIHFSGTHYSEGFAAGTSSWSYFVMEEADHKSLGDPQGYILDKGGYILMAAYDNEIVGTCALINDGNGVYELAKMAVAPKAQGLQIGKLLGEAALLKARQTGAVKVYLVSNRRLIPALNLYRKLGFTEVPMPPSIYERADIKMEIEL